MIAYNLSSGLGSSRFDSIPRSPDGDIPSLKESNGSILRNRYDNLTASARARSSRGTSSVSKKVSYAELTGPKLDTLRTENETLDKTERAVTPKKYYFFSDYLKDFNPGPTSSQTPAAGPIKSSVSDRPEENGQFETLKYRKVAAAAPKRDYALDIDTREPVSSVSEAMGIGENSSRRIRGNYTTTFGENLNKKEEIKHRLSQLSEKLYSPIKSTTRTEIRRSEVNEDTFERPYSRGATARDNQSNVVQNNLESFSSRTDEDFKSTTRVDSQGMDLKYKIMVQEYENSIRSLKSHLEKVERSNGEIVKKLREEIRDAREDLLKEKTENVTKNSGDMKTLGDKIRELENNLREERERTKQQEEALEENKAVYDKKLNEMTKEVDKVKTERERKIEELSTLLKSQNQSQRDIIAKIRAENEAIVKKLRDEQNYAVRDLNSQLDRRSTELERVQKEKNDALASLNEKIVSLQEITKNNQETYSRLNRTIELKDDEIEKLSRRLNDAKKDCSVLVNEIETLEHNKLKMEQENERLQTKITRLEKMIYGKGKTSPYKPV